MKSKWETKTLGEVCKKGSSNVSLNKIQDNEGEYPIYGAKGFLKKVDFYHQDKPYISIIKDGAGVGRVNLQEAKSSVIGTLQYIIPKDDIDINFLYYFLLGIDFEKYSCGAAIPHIYFKDYEKEEIKVPSLEEQEQIVKILDEVFESISKSKENAEKNLKNAKELFESYLEEIFSNPKEGWEEKKLGEVCNLSAGGDVPKDNFSKNITEKYKVPIFSNGINGKELYGYTDIEKVTEPSITISARGTIGYPEIRRKPFYPIIRLIVVIPESKILNLDFLKYALSRINFTKSGTSIPQLTVPMIREYDIVFPKSLAGQTAIVQKLDSLSSQVKQLEEIYKQKLKDLEELKKSMLQKAFSGELTKKS